MLTYVHIVYSFIIIMLKSREKGRNEIQRTENDHVGKCGPQATGTLKDVDSLKGLYSLKVL